MRIDQNGVEHFSSFEELAAAWKIKPASKVTKDKDKLKAQQERFVGRHKCKACGEPMIWVTGTSAMTCNNPACKGIKITRENDDGTKSVSYITSYDLLDETGMEIAENIFSVAI